MAFDVSQAVRDYGNPVEEAVACRLDAALFDFSFMARCRVRGARALDAIATITARRLDDLAVGRIRYALRAAPDGCLIADLTVWRTGPYDYEVMSGRVDDITEIGRAANQDAKIQDLTGSSRIYALQGPRSFDVLRPFLSPADAERLAEVPYFGAVEVELFGAPCLVGRLGYTGERGFELIVANENGAVVWNQLAKVARPAGFIAADVLRIEAGLVLFANEFSVPVTADEAGLGQFGAARLSSMAASRPAVSLVAFTAICDANLELFAPAKNIERPRNNEDLIVTSACRSAAAGGVLGLGYVLAPSGSTRQYVDPTGAFKSVRIVGLPYYDPEKRRPRGAWG